MSDKPTTAGIVFTTAVIRDSVKDDVEITTADFTPSSDGSSFAATFDFGSDSKVCNGKGFSLSVRFKSGSSVNLRSPKEPRNRIDTGRDSQFVGEGALQAKSSEQRPQFLTRLVRQNPDNPRRTITVTAVGEKNKPGSGLRSCDSSLVIGVGDALIAHAKMIATPVRAFY